MQLCANLPELPVDPIAFSEPESSISPLPSSSCYLPLPPSLIACSQWEKEECIGSGSFGYVYRGFNSEHGQFCAIKEVLVVLNDPRSKEQLKQLNQEICFLKQLSHPNIVQYYGSILTNTALSIYMEYVSEGSIHVLLGKHGPFKESMIRNCTAQILSGLAYLHERRHIHRDIKGANILVGSNRVVKLADFGFAKHISTLTEAHTSRAGTPYWMAPEVIVSKYSGKGYNLSADIWSLGCTVVEMATGKHPVHGFEPVAAMFKIASDTYEPEIPDKLSDEGKYFLLQCFRRDPRSRPTATQLMDHPFVREYRAAF